MPKLGDLSAGEGFTVECWLKSARFYTETLADSVDESGRGIIIRYTPDATIQIDFGDGISNFSWQSDRELFHPGEWLHATFIVDGGPKVVSIVIDGKLCDGGQNDERRYGWGYFGMSKPIQTDSHSHLLNMPPKKLLCAHEITNATGGNELFINRHHVFAL